MDYRAKVENFAEKHNMSTTLALSFMIEAFDVEAFERSELAKRTPLSIEELVTKTILTDVNRVGNSARKATVRKRRRKAPVKKAAAKKTGGRSKGSLNGTSKYPWAKWFDGKSHTLTKGKDFKIEVPSFQTSAHVAAKKFGVTIKTRTNGNKVTLTASKRKK